MSRRNPIPAPRRQTYITIPSGVGPHVKLVFTEMKRQNITYEDLEIGSGVLRATVKAWRVRNVPTLTSAEATLGHLGFDFVPIPRAKVLPPDLVNALRPVAERFALNMPATVQALVEIVTGIHSRFDDAPNALVSEPT